MEAPVDGDCAGTRESLLMLRTLIDKLFRRLARDLRDEADRRQLHPKRLLLEEAQREAAAYARERMAGALIFERREEIFDFALDRMLDDGLILEFGVAAGDSIRYLAARTDRKVHGFDSFEGLPEDWPGRHEAKGHYSTEGQLPSVPGNVDLHKGGFAETLPAFLARESGGVALLHVDCDLYGSTRTVLDQLAPRIGPGTVIVFDEYFNFIGWRNQEFKAFQEFVTATGVSYRYLAWGYQQAVVLVESARP
jgi:hypothetical protein